MFNIENFWDIIRYLNGQTVTSLDDNTKATAQSEKANATALFTNNIDQTAFATADYARLRKFIIDWYASLKTIVKISSKISDIRIIPPKHIDELFRSFGYNYSSSLPGTKPSVNDLKHRFFLDLVNLYKIKGSPRSIIEVLQWYGLNDVDLLEFWLKRDINSPDDLIFEGQIIASTSSDKLTITLPFASLTEGDPHWRMSESQIKTIASHTKINFPSKSPYFALMAKYNSEVDAAILSRRMQDEYEYYVLTGHVSETLGHVTLLDIDCSGLELYLLSIYLFNQLYNTGIVGSQFLCYDGSNTDYIEIINEYTHIIRNPISRADRENRLPQFVNLFSRLKLQNFLQNKNSAGNFLFVINHNIKNGIDSLISSYQATLYESFVSVLRDFGQWIRENIGYGYMNIIYPMLGLDILMQDYKNIINFFKPYRARLIPGEIIVFNNRLTDSVRVADYFDDVLVDEFIVDFITADSQPCYGMDSTALIFGYARETYDCGSLHDIGACIDEDPQIDIEQTEIDQVICLSDASCCIEWGYTDSTAVIDATAPIIFAWQACGWCDFDETGVFDCETGFDYCKIIVEDIIPSSASSSSSSSSSSNSSSSQSSSSMSSVSSRSSSSSLSSHSSLSSLSSSRSSSSISSMGPPLEATFTVQVGADDGFADNIDICRDYDNQVPFGYFEGADRNYSTWFRFQNVTIPAGATIVEATIEFESSNDGLDGACVIRLSFNDTDNASNPVSWADFYAKPRTTQYQDWNVPNFSFFTWYESIDFGNALQEVIDRPGWNSGQAVMVFLDYLEERYFRFSLTRDYGEGYAPKLHIKYYEL